MIRLLRRWRCHGTLWCCQYVDRAMCNSWHDPHLLARWRYRRQRRRERTDREHLGKASRVRR